MPPARAILLAVPLLLALAACGGDDGGGPNGPPPPPLPTPNVLRLADIEGAPGAPVTLTLSLENATALSGLQFDLTFDPAILTPTGAGADPTRAAGFDPFLSAGNGSLRVLLTDLDGSARIAPGSGPVATVTVDVDAGAPAGGTPVTVQNAIGVDASATTLSIGGSSATVTVR